MLQGFYIVNGGELQSVERRSSLVFSDADAVAGL
jgi:hypothetical protein